MSKIHPLACIDPKAELGRDVSVGAFAFVGPGVVLGDGCVLHNQCTILGPSTFGPRNEFYPHCVVGAAPQDLKYKGGDTTLRVGASNTFREHVTIHRGTEVDASVTIIGSNNLLMVGVHVAHDVIVGNNIILANYVQIAGHCHIEDRVNIGGSSVMHHFVTVGRYAYVGGITGMRADVPPYMKCSGWNFEVRGFNGEGMRRWGIPDPSIDAMKKAYRLLYGGRDENTPGRTLKSLEEIESNGLISDDHVRYLVDFLRRRLTSGTFGRFRESLRRDEAVDRKDFYSGNDTV